MWTENSYIKTVWQNKMIELKRCPFCLGSVDIKARANNSKIYINGSLRLKASVFVRCGGCGASGPENSYVFVPRTVHDAQTRKAKALAADDWNKRGSNL